MLTKSQRGFFLEIFPFRQALKNNKCVFLILSQDNLRSFAILNLQVLYWYPTNVVTLGQSKQHKKHRMPLSGQTVVLDVFSSFSSENHKSTHHPNEKTSTLNRFQGKRQST